jgi:hypothetical protein
LYVSKTIANTSNFSPAELKCYDGPQCLQEIHMDTSSHIKSYAAGKNGITCWLPTMHPCKPAAAVAMDLPHYDLDSRVYLSTDIVIVDLSKDSHGSFTATVTEPLFGSLRPGAKLDAVTPFLTFFQPLNDGQKVILFIARRPHQYGFFHQDAAKSPFAVPPSGVYLIDEYGHVHEYFQQNNPGPYVAQGYMFFHSIALSRDCRGFCSEIISLWAWESGLL